ncbi:MAG: hypothetical protein K2J36_04935 [Ruminococcus sp.]|nr:hypothetical protein [Ruminococcus sp.]MDE6797339.1 hypothetical protein [Ruminococcus sp.]
MFEKKEKRFIVKYEQNIGLSGVRIIVDTVTGVNYLNTTGSGSDGLTIMRDANDKIIVDDVSKLQEK